MPRSQTPPRGADDGSERGGVLLVTRNFPPLVGGMERLNRHLAEELARAGPVTLVAPREASAYAPPGVQILGVRSRPLAGFLLGATLTTVRAARAKKPRIVLAGSGLTVSIAWLGARLSGARGAVYVHGLDLTVRHPVYRALWPPYLRRLDVVIANSTATVRLAQNVGIDPGKTALVHPGTNLPDPDPDSRRRFRERYGLAPQTPVLLSVGRLTRRKGLREFVLEILPRIAAEVPDVVLVVVGSPPRSALHAGIETPEDLRAAARTVGLENRLLFTGDLFGRDFDDAYGGADLHVFPVRHDPRDPEGFGMVAIEAAALGLATVAFATGGVTEAVRDGISGRLVPPNNAHAFAQAACDLLTHPLSPDKIRDFARRFSWERFGCAVRAALDPAFRVCELEAKPPAVERIGTVVVTYHHDPELLLRQLRSLPSACPKIVVENTPEDERETDLGVLLHDVPEAILVESGGNRGLAAGLDLGARVLRTRAPEVTHVLFLDQDSEPEGDLLSSLARAYAALEASGRRPGAVGPRLLDPSTGSIHALHVMTRRRWKRVPPPEAGAPPVSVTNLNGSGTFMSLDLYKELGGFDRRLFIDHVDTEWSFRILASGRTLWCVPDALLVHRMGRGSLRFWIFGWRLWPLRSPKRHRTLFRNTLWLMRRKEIPRVWKAWAVVKLAVTALAHGALERDRLAQIRAMMRGVHEGLRPPWVYPLRVRVVKSNERPYPDPIALDAGDAVAPDFTRRTDIAGWVWATAADGRSGWVPKNWLSRIDGTWRIERAFNAIELTIAPGEELVVAGEESGFVWARRDDGDAGWVPKECVSPIGKA
jgi:phosphatidylinositol alpha-1,6-mannosyltransferase